MRIYRIVFVVFLTIVLVMPAAAQDFKFGHISVADVILLMPEYKNIGTVMETETKKLEDQLGVMQGELKKLETEYENNYESYTDQQRADKEEAYGAMQQRVQDFYANAQKSLQQKQQELQDPVLAKLRETIDAVGRENGFLYIFEVNSGLTLYHSAKSEDVTPLVKAKLGLL
jgi:outer membrane protein